MVTEVKSPVCRPGSKVGSIRSGDLSPGACSMPGARGDQQGSPPEPSLHQPPQHDRRDRRGDQEEPERKQQEERADSVFGLLKRLLPRRQRPEPYVYIGFPRAGGE
jgi:hypothetical protein